MHTRASLEGERHDAPRCVKCASPTPPPPSPQWTKCSSPVLSMMQARVVDRHEFQVEYLPFFGAEPSAEAPTRAAWVARIAANEARKKYEPQRHEVEERLALGSQTFDTVSQATRKEYTSMAAKQAGLDAQATIGAAGDAALLLEPKDGYYRSESIVLHAPDCLECRLAAHAGALLIAAVKAGEPLAAAAPAAVQAAPAQAAGGKPAQGQALPPGALDGANAAGGEDEPAAAGGDGGGGEEADDEMDFLDESVQEQLAVMAATEGDEEEAVAFAAEEAAAYDTDSHTEILQGEREDGGGSSSSASSGPRRNARRNVSRPLGSGTPPPLAPPPRRFPRASAAGAASALKALQAAQAEKERENSRKRAAKRAVNLAERAASAAAQAADAAAEGGGRAAGRGKRKREEVPDAAAQRDASTVHQDLGCVHKDAGPAARGAGSWFKSGIHKCELCGLRWCGACFPAEGAEQPTAAGAPWACPTCVLELKVSEPRADAQQHARRLATRRVSS